MKNSQIQWMYNFGAMHHIKVRRRPVVLQIDILRVPCLLLMWKMRLLAVYSPSIGGRRAKQIPKIHKILSCTNITICYSARIKILDVIGNLGKLQLILIEREYEGMYNKNIL